MHGRIYSRNQLNMSVSENLHVSNRLIANCAPPPHHTYDLTELCFQYLQFKGVLGVLGRAVVAETHSKIICEFRAQIESVFMKETEVFLK